MSLRSLPAVASLLLWLSASSLAQSPSPTPTPTSSALAAESSEFTRSLISYYHSFEHSPQLSSIGVNLFLDPNVPQGLIASITDSYDALLPVPTTGYVDLSSLATDPPLTFSTLPWESKLPAGVASDIKSLQTSAALAIATIDQKILGISQSIALPTATARSTGGAALPARQTGVAGAAVVVAGAVGAAAVLL